MVTLLRRFYYMPREEAIEKYLRSKVAERDGVCVKISPFGLRGVPDRLILLPGPLVIFAELKRPSGGRVSRHQYRWRDWLTSRGFRHVFLYTRKDVDLLMEALPDD